MKVWLLISEDCPAPGEGGIGDRVVGVYSSREKAEEAAAKDPLVSSWMTVREATLDEPIDW